MRGSTLNQLRGALCLRGDINPARA